MKVFRYILMVAVLGCWGCSDEKAEPANEPAADGEIYLTVDMDAPASRVAYEFAKGEGVEASGSIRATWQIGDIIKVYEIGVHGNGDSYSDAYESYEDYEARHPYPSAPIVDTYYRFVCEGGEGTAQGRFKYIGLATATVVNDPVKNIHNVNVDIKYNHKIRNWSTFQGLVVYGNPLRNTMMRTQTAPNDLTHLRFGERMYGYVCAHNFQWWHGSTTPGAMKTGIDRITLKNVGGCVYRLIIGGVDVPIYGGSTLTLTIPGVTDQNVAGCPMRNEPMTLTLGDPNDYVLGFAPWAKADDPALPASEKAFCAYIVGWDGTLQAGRTATVVLHESYTGYTYTWSLTSDKDINFVAGPYYTIDLRDHNAVKS